MQRNKVNIYIYFLLEVIVSNINTHRFVGHDSYSGGTGQLYGGYPRHGIIMMDGTQYVRKKPLIYEISLPVSFRLQF